MKYLHDTYSPLCDGWEDALIGAVGGLFGSFGNAAAQQEINEQNIAFAREMYAQQRSDALADRAHLEEYNDPAAQRARLVNAGLNPNLMYGNGGAVNTVNQLPYQATANMPNLQAPRVDLDALNIAQVMANIKKTQNEAAAAKSQADKMSAEEYGVLLDNKEKEANSEYFVSNAKLDNSLKQIAADLSSWKEREAYFTYFRNSYKYTLIRMLHSSEGDGKDIIYDFDTPLGKELLSELNREKLTNDQIQATINHLSAAATNALANALLAKKQGLKVDKEIILLDFEHELNKYGLTKSDSRPWRLLSLLFDKIFDSGTLGDIGTGVLNGMSDQSHK